MPTVQTSTEIRECSRGERSPVKGIPLPGWVGPLVAAFDSEVPRQFAVEHFGATVHGSEGRHLALCSTVIRDAALLPEQALRDQTTAAFRALFRAASGLRACHRVRMWSFIPEIHSRRGSDLTTYFIFNQGRYAAFLEAAAADRDFAVVVPTATGVGARATHDLVVHCLTSVEPGIHIENPRQIPSYRYSAKYGPKPPCFARGTILRDREVLRLLVGGTASIRDESSMHPNDLKAQLDETIENLAALNGVAEKLTRSKAAFTHLRAYCTQPDSVPVVSECLRKRLGPGPQLETVIADLCRDDLLVEIEAVVELKGE